MPRASLREINRIALPAIVAGIAEPLISLGDLAIVGRVPEHPTEVLAAVGLAGSFLSALVWILAQFKAAISSSVSRHLGAERLEDADTLVPQTLWLSFGLSVVVFLATFPAAREIFRLYNARGLTLDYAVDYFRIRALGFPFTLLTFSIFGVLRGLQDTWHAMLVSILGGLLNIALDLLLVFGAGPIPPLGMEGAAWASVAAQGAMTLAALWLLFRKTPFSLRLRLPLHPELGRIAHMSANLVVRTAALNFALYLANRTAATYGEAHIAAHTIAFNVWIFSAFFIDGYANAGIAIAGRQLGAGDWEGLGRLGHDLVRYSLVIAFIAAGLMAVAYPVAGRLFSSDPVVLGLFGGVFWMVLLIQPLNALAFAYDGVFKGLGRAVLLRNVLLFATFAGFVAAIFLGDALDLGLYGVWGAFFVWMGERGVTLELLYRRFLRHRTG